MEFNLNELGAIAMFIPAVAGVSKQTVDIIRGSFGIGPRIRVTLNYLFSFGLMGMLLYATNNLVVYQDLLKTAIAAILAANLAASINATHKEARANDPPEGDMEPEIVEGSESSTEVTPTKVVRPNRAQRRAMAKHGTPVVTGRVASG